LLDELPEHYLVKIQERVASVTVPDHTAKQAVLDVGISAPADYEPGGGAAPAAVSTIEPVTLEHDFIEPLTETYLEILRRSDRKLVTVIELLSPTNKEGRGSDFYLLKRETLLAQPVHLVEIDLLVRGTRLPMKEPLPRGDYYAFVSRAERRFTGDVYAWSVRQPLPILPVPVLAPDPDAKLDLAALFRQAYDRGRYERELDYTGPPPAFLRSEDREWAKTLLAGRG
jgi:Protein of unknown function (DUF4058)